MMSCSGARLLVVAMVTATLTFLANGDIQTRWGPQPTNWSSPATDVDVLVLDDGNASFPDVVIVKNRVVATVLPWQLESYTTFDLQTGRRLCEKDFKDKSVAFSGPVLMQIEDSSAKFTNMRTCNSIDLVNYTTMFAAGKRFAVYKKSYYAPNVPQGTPFAIAKTSFDHGIQSVQMECIRSLMQMWVMSDSPTLVTLGNVLPDSTGKEPVLSFAGFNLDSMLKAAKEGQGSTLAPSWVVTLGTIPMYQQVYETERGGVVIYRTTNAGFAVDCIGPDATVKTLTSHQQCYITNVVGGSFVCIYHENYAYVVDVEACEKTYETFVGQQGDGKPVQVGAVKEKNSSELVFVQSEGNDLVTEFILMSPKTASGAELIALPQDSSYVVTTTRSFVVVAGMSSAMSFAADGNQAGSWSSDSLGTPLAAGGSKTSNFAAIIDSTGNVVCFETAYTPTMTITPARTPTVSQTGIPVPGDLTLCTHSRESSQNITIETTVGTTNLVVITVSYMYAGRKRVRQNGYSEQFVLNHKESAGAFCLDSGSWATFAEHLEKVYTDSPFTALCFSAGAEMDPQINWEVAELRSLTSSERMTSNCYKEQRCELNHIGQYETKEVMYKPFSSSDVLETGMSTVLLKPSRGSWKFGSKPLYKCFTSSELANTVQESELERDQDGQQRLDQVRSACSASTCAVRSCEGVAAVAFELFWCYSSFGVYPTVDTVLQYVDETASWIVNTTTCRIELGLIIEAFQTNSRVKFVPKIVNGTHATFLTNCDELPAKATPQFEGQFALVGWSQQPKIWQLALADRSGLNIELTPCIPYGQENLIALPYIVIFIGNIFTVILTVALNILMEKTRLRNWIIRARVAILIAVFPSEFTRGDFYNIESVTKARHRFRKDLENFYLARAPKSRAYFEMTFENIYKNLMIRYKGKRHLNKDTKHLCDDFFWNQFTKRGSRIIAPDSSNRPNPRSNFKRVLDVFEAVIDDYFAHLHDRSGDSLVFQHLAIGQSILRLMEAPSSEEDDDTNILSEDSMNTAQSGEGLEAPVNSLRREQDVQESDMEEDAFESVQSFNPGPDSELPRSILKSDGGSRSNLGGSRSNFGSQTRISIAEPPSTSRLTDHSFSRNRFSSYGYGAVYADVDSRDREPEAADYRGQQIYSDAERTPSESEHSSGGQSSADSAEAEGFDYVRQRDVRRRAGSTTSSTEGLTEIEKRLQQVDFIGGIYLVHDWENRLLFSAEAWVLSLETLVVFVYLFFIILRAYIECANCSALERYQSVYFHFVNSGIPTSFLISTYLRGFVTQWSQLSKFFAILATSLFAPAFFSHMIPGYFKFIIVTLPATLAALILFYLIVRVVRLPSMPSYRCRKLFRRSLFRFIFFSAFDEHHKMVLAHTVGRNSDRALDARSETATTLTAALTEPRIEHRTNARESLRFFTKVMLRIGITFIATIVIQVSFNYALLNIYGSTGGYFETIRFDYTARRVACSMYSFLEEWSASKVQVLTTLFSV